MGESTEAISIHMFNHVFKVRPMWPIFAGPMLVKRGGGDTILVNPFITWILRSGYQAKCAKLLNYSFNNTSEILGQRYRSPTSLRLRQALQSGQRSISIVTRDQQLISS